MECGSRNYDSGTFGIGKACIVEMVCHCVLQELMRILHFFDGGAVETPGKRMYKER